ncbi:MAG: trigger factor [Patescibacteria group bacterium]|uniref:Trigger factor ribosome-binding bacterial domain-containing protein n=1 Tax=candidate division WWE3 bacterium TaxID=2053526 RepID=A0A955EC04_UNCKA|nr:hypothetical protein [candidate division WWE3 bacterium]
MQVKVNKKPKSTVELNITVPASKVKQTYDSVLSEVVVHTTVPGFRKGKAPKDKVLERTDISKLYGEVVNALLKNYYPQALKENKIEPVSNPQVEIKEFDLEKDFNFIATVAVKPDVKVGDYKKALKKAYEQLKKQTQEDNKEKLEKGEELTTDDKVNLSSAHVIEAILEVSKMELSDMLVEQEAERMLSRLINQAQAVGLTLERYLEAQGKTEEQLKEDYKKVAENTLQSEFALNQLVKDLGIEIPDQEIEDMINASGIPDASAKLQSPTEKWYIKSILEKNKLITQLIEEVEGGTKDAK